MNSFAPGTMTACPSAWASSLLDALAHSKLSFSATCYFNNKNQFLFMLQQGPHWQTPPSRGPGSSTINSMHSCKPCPRRHTRHSQLQGRDSRPPWPPTVAPTQAATAALLLLLLLLAAALLLLLLLVAAAAAAAC